jgi:hypothetical protein
MLQREVAANIGVTESSVWNWERGTEPELVHIPKIIELLECVPFECPNDLLGRLRYFKTVNRMSFERLGAAMRRGPEQLTDWFTGRSCPCPKNRLAIEALLTMMTE